MYIICHPKTFYIESVCDEWATILLVLTRVSHDRKDCRPSMIFQAFSVIIISNKANKAPQPNYRQESVIISTTLPASNKTVTSSVDFTERIPIC